MINTTAKLLILSISCWIR